MEPPSRFSSMDAEAERSLEKKTNSGLGSHPGVNLEAASRFTDDLILEILSRLPARSVHRFNCKTICVPRGRRFGMIGASQGCLHYAIASVDDNNKILVSEIELWCLKDRDSKQLVLKHTANIDKLMSMTGQKYRVVSIHPDCDTIFLVSCGDGTLVSYDMQHQKVGRILNLEKENAQRFLPYVPLFSESLAVADADR